jgi:hypothetical protein
LRGLRWLGLAALGIACAARFLTPAGTAWAGAPPVQPITENCHGVSVGERSLHVCGTLNPGVSERVEYHFAYNVGSDCAGGEESAPEPPVEGENVAVSAYLQVQPDTQYAVCLVAVNEFGETFGEALVYKTLPPGEPPEPPLTEACAEPGSADAQPVCGTISPNSVENAGYYFSSNLCSDCTGGAKTPTEPPVVGEGIAVSAVLTGLAVEAVYSYCLVAVNQFGETFGAPLSFRAGAATSPPAPNPPSGGTAPLQQADLLAVLASRELQSRWLKAKRRFLRRMKACATLSRNRRAGCRRRARARYRRAREHWEGARAPG